MSEVASTGSVEGNSGMDPAKPVDLCLKLLNDQLYCDLFFVVGPERERLGAHKHVLEARSSYFKTMFSERWINRPENDVNIHEIVLKDDKPWIFRSFLKHIYAFVFSANPIQAVQLLTLDNYYDIQSLVKCCQEVLAAPFQLDDILEIFATAKEFKMPTVAVKAGDTMANYFEQLVKSSAFEKVDETTLMYLLERDDLNMEEFEIFLFLLRWADTRIENSIMDPKPGRTDMLKNVIPLIRFPTMGEYLFAEHVVLTNVLTVETERNLFLYFCLSDGDKRKAVASKVPYSSVPRNNDILASVDLYDQLDRPGKGTYPKVALRKASNIRDILTMSFPDSLGKNPTRPTVCQIVSLVLDAPKYGEPLLFQNSSEVAEMNLPIKVGISCSEINTRTNKPNWISEEVVVDLGLGQMVLMLHKPWVLSVNKYQSYKIITRFLSDVYTVPDAVLDESEDQTNLKKEDIDFFTGTTLSNRIFVPLETRSWMRLTISGDERKYKSSSSGVHLVRSIQFTNI